MIIIIVYEITGGSFPFTVGRIEHGHKVRPDLCAVDNEISPRKYLSSFYTDSLVHDPVALKLLIDVIGKVSNLSVFELMRRFPQFNSFDQMLSYTNINMLVLPCQDKVMLGTDYPFPLGELQPGSLIESVEEFDETLKALTTFLSFQQIKL